MGEPEQFIDDAGIFDIAFFDRAGARWAVRLDSVSMMYCTRYFR